MRAAVTFVLLLALPACDPVPVDPYAAAEECEGRARAAQGPTGTIGLGVNSRTGGFVTGEVGITSDYLNGRDPVEVYEACVWRRTGAAPVRPPRLR